MAKELGSELREFGFDDGSEAWLSELAGALLPPELGAIGPYELLGEVARGGQGVVYRARQLGTEREIALKRLVEGRTATASTRRRFERELEAAARLRHPGIVTVLGLEEVEGDPLLAMSWVEGASIDSWALGLQKVGRLNCVLRCFLRVCEAVEHAHRYGVLHLDLKPSNILVGEDDQPVVIDFGLARLEETGTSLTREGAFLGTLAYASPEQLQGTRADLDARSDVYSLGVLLYELATSERPFDFEGGVGAALAQQERGKYTAPSTLLPNEPGLLRRELDAIVGRALSPARGERYSSVAALTEDMRRLLGGRPVLAHPPGALYEMRKFVRQHRAVTGLLLLLVASLVAFGVVVSRKNRQLELERGRESSARAAAQLAEQGARAEADSRNDVMKYLLDDLFDGPLSYDRDQTLTVVDLIDAASGGATDHFSSRPRVESELRGKLAQLNRRVGRIAESEVELRRALELAEEDDSVRASLEIDLARTLGGLTRWEEALLLLSDVLARRDVLEPKLVCQALTEYGAAFVARRQLDEAESTLLEARELARDFGDDYLLIEVLRHLGVAYGMRGRYREARATYGEAMAIAQARGNGKDEQLLTVSAYLGDLDQVSGYMEAAERHARMALDGLTETYGEMHPRVVAALGDLGEVLSERGRMDEADEMLRTAVAGSEALRGEDSVVTFVHRARLLRNELRRGELDGTLKGLEACHARFTAQFGPSSAWARKTTDALIAGYAATGADASSRKLVQELLELQKAYPTTETLAQTLLFSAELAHGLGRREHAQKLLGEALDGLREMRAGATEFPGYLARRAADFYRGRGDVEFVQLVESYDYE